MNDSADHADKVNRCGSEGCDGEGKWRWWNGMGTFGPYCDDCAREQLDDDDRCPITRREDVSGTYALPAGIQPVGKSFPTIRTKGAFDTYLETEGEQPHQCDVSWCSRLGDECGHEGENPLVTDGGRPNAGGAHEEPLKNFEVGDEITVSSRETPMTVDSKTKRRNGNYVIEASNHNGTYRLKGYADGKIALWASAAHDSMVEVEYAE